jgi:hypothetical protein
VQERRKKSAELYEQKVANEPYTLLKKEVARTKELEAKVESLKLKWTKELPSQVGWYWRRDKLFDDGLRCVEIRDYAGRLAIGNCVIKDDDFWNHYEWAGPIPVPEG